MLPVKAMLLDVDGVLAIARPFSHTMEKQYGITREMTSPFFQGIFLECITGRADLKQEIASYLQEWGWPGTVDKFIEAWFETEHQVNEPLLAVVQQLRNQGIPCYLATNQERYRTEYILKRMEFSTRFDGIFSSAYVGYAKPDREFFEAVLSGLKGIAPEEILFWDDNAGHIAAAREVGLQAEVYQSVEEFVTVLRRYFPLNMPIEHELDS
ncbi:MAG TPA: HAD-IA family hydrolase [Ktedonobacteraceae bacterium]|nr:HAD-IA family hydrolase [Ktedonobacteraceae bacterium]